MIFLPMQQKEPKMDACMLSRVLMLLERSITVFVFVHAGCQVVGKTTEGLIKRGIRL